MAGVVLVLSLFGNKGFFAHQSLLSQEQALEKELFELQAEKEEWQSRLRALQRGSIYETLARQKLGLIEPNEILIQVSQ